MANPEPIWRARVPVTADKQGRYVEVTVEHGGIREGATIRDHAPAAVSLTIGPAGSGDPWTWLSLDETRALATALTEAVREVEERNARDPRS